jgi:hypothetical protein
MKSKGHAATLLGGLLEPLGRCLTPASAREILAVQADESLQRRVAELADKSDAGGLSSDERVEYQLFVEVGDLLALLQARARRFLADHPGN